MRGGRLAACIGIGIARVLVSWFPRFDRNLNTGEDPATGTRMVAATQTIHHSARYPSHIVLPIIPQSTTSARAR